MSMSAMDVFFVLESENNVVGDKSKVEKTGKRSLGGPARKGLADISNLPQHPKTVTQDEKSQVIPASTKAYIDQLKKENKALVKLLEDRNEIIELSGIELQRLRVNLQKMQQQNLQLAQSNSQMLVELNLGKDRLKTLQHELGCKTGLLKVKGLQLEEKEKANGIRCQKIEIQTEMTMCEETGESAKTQGADDRRYNTNRRQQSKSLGPSTAKEKAENKRLCVRRQSARFKSEEPKPTEGLLEIDDAKFSLCPLLDDQVHNDGSASVCPSVKKDDEESDFDPRYEAQTLPTRSSVGRPLRHAAQKVQSYKEIPLNVKMRRCE